MEVTELVFDFGKRSSTFCQVAFEVADSNVHVIPG